MAFDPIKYAVDFENFYKRDSGPNATPPLPHKRHCTLARYVVVSFLESAQYFFNITENLISTVDEGKR